jgi:hypothetical protein
MSLGSLASNTYEDPDCQEIDYSSERIFYFFIRVPGLGAVDGRSHVLT